MGTAFLHYRSTSCRHSDSCFINALKVSLNSLKYGVIIEAGRELIRVIMMMVKQKSFRGALAFLFSASFERLRIPLFLLVNSLVLRGGHCILKYIRGKDDWWNSLTAGLLCGLLSMSLLKHSQWYLVLSLIGARIVESLYRIAISRGILKEENSNLHFYVMFAIGNLINAYGFFVEGDIIEGDMEGLYSRMAALDSKENMWLRSSLIFKKTQMQEKGYSFPTNKLNRRIDALTNGPHKLTGF